MQRLADHFVSHAAYLLQFTHDQDSQFEFMRFNETSHFLSMKPLQMTTFHPHGNNKAIRLCSTLKTHRCSYKFVI